MVQDFQYFQSFLFNNRRCLEYVTDKTKSSASIINYMLARLQKMFKYSGLPSSIPRQYLENYLLINGHCIIARDKKNPSDPSIYAFVGAAGGEPDIYYRPTRYMVANPSLQFSAEYYISSTDPNHEPDAILIRNDTMWQGLYPMMARYASLISENLLTIRTADVMLRVLALITAPDDSSRLAANQFLKDIEDGHLSSIAENRFLDGIRMQNPPSNNGSYLTQFIELHQYLIGSFYNEVGLNANYNMKREALSESETGLNDDSLLPLCDDMLRCRQEDIASVNAMFGTSIEVTFDSSWLENEIERLLNLKQLATEASSQLVNPAGQGDGKEDSSKEGASMEGVSNQMEGGQEEDADGNGESGNEESGNEDRSSGNGEEKSGDKEDDAEDGGEDPGSSDGDSLEEEDQSDGDEVEESNIEQKIDEQVDDLIERMIEEPEEQGDIKEEEKKEEEKKEEKEGGEDEEKSETEGMPSDS